MEQSEKAGAQESLVLSDSPSFTSVLEKTCDRLWEKKIAHSMRRIGELEDNLRRLEQELDDLFPGGGHGSR
jgi:hypothetical protein